MFELQFELDNIEVQLDALVQEAKFDSNNAISCSYNVEELIYEAINDNDEYSLKQILNQTRAFITQESYARVLLLACDRLFATGVAVLLEHGANPNQPVKDFKTGNDTVPLVFVINRCGPDLGYRPGEGELKKNANAYNDIISALIDHGADLSARDPTVPFQWANEERYFGRNTLPLHKLAYLTLYGQQPALRLVEESPVNEVLLAEPSAVLKCSPVAAIFYDLILMNQSFGLNPLRSAKMISRGLLPLLRSGARFMPDPLEADEAIHSSLPVFWFHFQEYALSNLLWNRSNGLIELLLELRRRPHFDVAKFMRSLTFGTSQNVPTSDPKDGSLLSKYYLFSKAVRASFPMKLQSLARHAVFERLPVGLKQRSAAIERLDMLPQCIRAYLNFCDFECNC